MPALAAEDSDSTGLRLVSVKAEHPPRIHPEGDVQSALAWTVLPGLLHLLALSGLLKLTNSSPITLHAHFCKQTTVHKQTRQP